MGIFKRISCNTGTPSIFGVDLQLIDNKEGLIINYHQNLENINISKTHNVSFISKLCRHSAIKRVLRLLYRAQNRGGL